MRKALVIIAAVAVLGVLAAAADPLGGESGISTEKTVGSAGSAAATQASSSQTPSVAANYKDGTYRGSDESNPYGDVQISVTIQGGKITTVNFDQLTADDPRSRQINTQAAGILKNETLTTQNAAIDGVSGATYTSASYEQSLQSALDKAKA